MNDQKWPARPLLAGLYHVVVLDDDRVRIGNAGRSVLVSGDGVAGRVGPALDAFDGRHQVAELEDRFGPVVGELLASLVPKGLVVEGDGDTDRSTGAPGLAALALATEGSGLAGAIRRLATATVVLVGCGPVGGTVAVQLSKAGVGRLRLVDGASTSARDVAVSPVLAPAAEGVGRMGATKAAAETVTDGRVQVSTGALTAETLADADLAVVELVHARDDRPPGDPEASLCLDAGVAHLLYGQDGLEATVGPVVRPGGAPCHRCLDTRRLGHLERIEEQRAYRRHRAETAPGADAFVAAHTAITAGITCTVALRALLSADSVADRQAVVIDLTTMATRREEVLPVPECPTCGTGGAGMG